MSPPKCESTMKKVVLILIFSMVLIMARALDGTGNSLTSKVESECCRIEKISEDFEVASEG